ncbi:N-acetyltransferase family protein [Streptomyces sp. URMC 127]|uniref:GNAT family N-acetyltransferase n=1 Tax=Streptomyces sp. URMC 127 TaxID=3423402 RepID=UPI003F1E0821
MTDVTITPVRGRAATTAFIRLPHALYRHDPHWVAPLEHELRACLDPRRNPFHATGTARLFLAHRGRTALGRIAAHIDPRFQQRHHERTGHIGFFECTDDPSVAGALFAAADRWLAERGADRVLGPLSFTTNDECGVLVDGFDRPPTVQMPHNPPYYADLFTACGFTKAKDLHTFTGPVPADGAAPAAITRAAQRALSAPDVRVRPLDPRRRAGDLEAVLRIYNDAWAGNYASVPFTDAEFRHLLRRLKPVLVPELLQIAEVGGEPAGFTLWLPDANQALAAARGRLTTCGLPVGLLRAARARRRITRTRASTSGVTREHRGRGLMAALLCRAQQAAARLGYTENEYSWILEDNRDSARHARAMGAVHTRTHRLYHRPVGPAPAAAS